MCIRDRKVVSERQPTLAEWNALRFAWKACQHVKSNAIVLAQGEATVGIGGGQPNRVDCVRIAVQRAGDRTQGAVMASDANRSLLFLDATAQPRLTIPYGKDLPASFKYVLALCTDPTGNVAAIVDGDFEGVVVWGPDGALLRQATFKALGLNGKYRALALDRQGGILLADRSNDLLIRLN